MIDRVNVFSPTYQQSNSYGRLANQLADGVERLGIHANRMGFNRPENAPPIQLATGGFLLAIPDAFPMYGALANIGPRVALTMLETTRIPQSWVEQLNRCHAVIVPAQFCVDSFRASGVTVPIHVIPLGISDVFKAPRRRTYRKPFRVLVIGDRGDRKNWYSAIQMFLYAFGDNPKFHLTIKSHWLPFRPTNRNISVLEGKFTDEEMRDLYHRHHVMLFPTKGEGFGYPPREFAATGGVAIATDWGGTADDLLHWGVPIDDYSFEPAYSLNEMFAGKSGDWVVPSIKRSAQQLRRVARNFSLYADTAMLSADYVARRYREDAFVRECWQVYSDVARQFTQERQAS